MAQPTLQKIACFFQEVTLNYMLKNCTLYEKNTRYLFSRKLYELSRKLFVFAFFSPEMPAFGALLQKLSRKQSLCLLIFFIVPKMDSSWEIPGQVHIMYLANFDFFNKKLIAMHRMDIFILEKLRSFPFSRKCNSWKNVLSGAQIDPIFYILFIYLC